jgi:hypothetical protein
LKLLDPGNSNVTVMKSLYTISICLLLSSCLQEDLEPSEYAFRGSWDSPRYAIRIFMNGSATLDIRGRGSLEGFVKIKGERMLFYSENENDEIAYKRLDIDQRPTTDSNGITFMVLEGETLYRH